ncbi:ATP-binding cassette domain-containing protein [Nocardia sp. NPDC005978]|uniref:ABC transporter ATP-binding protein/permease n=1 Tax=Nocardia sp. NPDC005978 TaxID=3156725 RepID=UPI0033BC12F2
MARPVDPRLWRYARSARMYLALSVALSLLTTVSIVAAALALARVLAGVITDPSRRDIGSWRTELAIFTIAVLCRVAATWWQSRLAHRAGARVVAELETAVLTVGAQLPPRELESRRTELAVVVGSGLSGLRAYLAGYLPALLLSLLVPPIVLVVIATHDWISGAIILVTLPLIPIFMILIGLLTKGRAAETLTATTRLSDQLLDLFAGMPTLRALGREGGRDGAAAAPIAPHRYGEPAPMRARATESTTGPDAETPSVADRATMQHRVRRLGDDLHRRTMSALRIAFLSSMVLEALATLSVALVAVSIGLRLVYGEMGLYAGLLALILAPEVYLPLRAVGERFHAAQDGMAAAEKAFAVLDPDTVGPRTAVPEARTPGAAGAEVGQGSVDSREQSGHIEIRGLSVAARDGMAPHALSGTIRRGAVTVLAGANGSGKSTALQAILRLVPPAAGTITIDGVPVAELDPDAWWSRVAWLPQRPVLVPGTLRDNIELLGPPAGTDLLDAACHATGFDEVLAELPDGWNTRVGANGAGLSLGQRQRLALTRTLAADRAVLLLDEPTAHLDPDSETRVLQALRARAAAGTTVVLVGHRPTVLAIADEILPVDAIHAVSADSAPAAVPTTDVDSARPVAPGPGPAASDNVFGSRPMSSNAARAGVHVSNAMASGSSRHLMGDAGAMTTSSTAGHRDR